MNWWWIFRTAVMAAVFLALELTGHRITSIGWVLAYIGIGIGVAASCDLVRWSYRQHGPPSPEGCVYCGSREGPFKNHCGTGDMVCTDDSGCLARGWRGSAQTPRSRF